MTFRPRNLHRISFLMLALLMVAPLAGAEAAADVAERFSMVPGEDAVQAGCITLSREDNPCHQIATSMNGLDSPKIDVLILVPVSPAAERDMRILRQSTEMWADGIEWMARDMGLDWLADGVEFHIFMEMINTGESEFTTYPIVDPEIVIVASNPVGGIGIGIDPIDFAGILFGEGASEGPCHGVANPFDHAVWENLPGFESHHGGRSGTYTEDCGGNGGNVCFSVNAAVDPMTSLIDIFQLYDLASHETGHCLTLGHVGDGAEGSWSGVPTNDIMAYHSDPPGISKCVSSLDVEAFAVSMSKYLDTNGDGEVTDVDRWYANDAEGEFDDRPFQIQHPDNHFYVSPTRNALDCPQPDMGPVPLAETVNFTGGAPARDFLAIQGLRTGQIVAQGPLTVGGVAGAGDIIVSFRTMDAFWNDTYGGTFDAAHNVTARVDGANWTATLDLSAVPAGSQIIVSAAWLDGELVDSDRVALLVGPAVARPAADEDRDVPGLAFLVVLGVLGAFAIRRR